MSRILSLAKFFPVVFFAFVSLTGCTHFLENRSVNRFQAAWHKQDLNQLRKQSSERFQRTALYRSDIQEDLKQLNLPEGKLKVTHVEKTEDGLKKVRVSVDGSKRESLFVYAQDRTSGKWFVDDILMKQRRSRGLKVVRSVSEQMNLLQSVRDFREAWTVGNKKQMLAMLAPELRNSISSLPPGYFQKLSQEIAKKMESKVDRKPNAELNGDSAIVSVRGAKGKIILQMKSEQDRWQVKDFAIEGSNRDKHIPSVLKLARVLNISTDFLDAYVRNDLKALEQISHTDLYKNGLVFADLKSVPLPTSAEANSDYDVTIKNHRAEFVVNTPDSVVKLSLSKDIAPTEHTETKNFVVSDVTIYDRNSNQKTELTSAFMAHAMVEIFRDTLAERNLVSLKKISTTDFNNRVWNELDSDLMKQMPVDPNYASPPKIVETDHQGVVTRIHVLQNGQRMTYVMRKEGGRILIDDIESSKSGFEKSLKSVMQAMIPVRKFAVGVIVRKPKLLQRVSSKDFNRIIWKHVDDIPPSALFIPKHTNAPLRSIVEHGNDIIVTLGDRKWGARIALVEEYGKYLVDDIQLISGEMPHQKLLVKDALRTEVSHGIRTLAESPRQPGMKTGSLANFPAKGNPTPQTNPSFKNDRIMQTGHDRLQNSPVMKFQPLPLHHAHNAAPAFEDFATENVETPMPNRSAFGMENNSRNSLNSHNHRQSMPKQNRQRSPVHDPAKSEKIPVPKGNTFDRTSHPPVSYGGMSHSKSVPPANLPVPSNTKSNVPSWDSFPGESSKGNATQPKNQWSNWDTQPTGNPQGSMQNGREDPMQQPQTNRPNQWNSQNTGKKTSGLILAPGIPARHTQNSPASTTNPFSNNPGSGTRR